MKGYHAAIWQVSGRKFKGEIVEAELQSIKIKLPESWLAASRLIPFDASMGEPIRPPR